MWPLFAAGFEVPFKPAREFRTKPLRNTSLSLLRQSLANLRKMVA